MGSVAAPSLAAGMDRRRPRGPCGPVASCPVWASRIWCPLGEKAHAKLTKRGFQEIEDWKSCYWLREDFKLSGPIASMEDAWLRIRAGIVTGDPHPLNHFLGCTHEPVWIRPPGCDRPVRGQVKNMEGFFRKTCDTFKQLSGITILGYAPTPIHERIARSCLCAESRR